MNIATFFVLRGTTPSLDDTVRSSSSPPVERTSTQVNRVFARRTSQSGGSAESQWSFAGELAG